MRIKKNKKNSEVSSRNIRVRKTQNKSVIKYLPRCSYYLLYSTVINFQTKKLALSCPSHLKKRGGMGGYEGKKNQLFIYKWSCLPAAMRVKTVLCINARIKTKKMQIYF